MSRLKISSVKEKIEFDNNVFSGEFLCGCDEVGRGPLAGPVVCASCILPKDYIIEGIDDSKKLSPKKRKMLFEEIKKHAICYNIAFIDEKTIDKLNILNATKRCMEQAINGLSVKPNFAIIDAVSNLNLVCEYKSAVKGDLKSYIVGASSILAKVARDEYMEKQSEIYPEYNFAKHKGYGTKEHMDNLRKFGPCEIHRKSFLGFLKDVK